MASLKQRLAGLARLILEKAQGATAANEQEAGQGPLDWQGVQAAAKELLQLINQHIDPSKLVLIDTLELASRADVALVGIGAFEPGSTLLSNGSTLTPEEVADLKVRGVAGDIALQFFDTDGRKMDHPINSRIVGTNLEKISSIGRVIGVAGGPQKRQAIRAALRGRLINVLVTDDQTAKWLLE